MPWPSVHKPPAASAVTSAHNTASRRSIAAATPPEVPTTHSAQARHFLASRGIWEQQKGQDLSWDASVSLELRSAGASMRRHSGAWDDSPYGGVSPLVSADQYSRVAGT